MRAQVPGTGSAGSPRVTHPNKTSAPASVPGPLAHTGFVLHYDRRRLLHTLCTNHVRTPQNFRMSVYMGTAFWHIVGSKAQCCGKVCCAGVRATTSS